MDLARHYCRETRNLHKQLKSVKPSFKLKISNLSVLNSCSVYLFDSKGLPSWRQRGWRGQKLAETFSRSCAVMMKWTDFGWIFIRWQSPGFRWANCRKRAALTAQLARASSAKCFNDKWPLVLVLPCWSNCSIRDGKVIIHEPTLLFPLAPAFSVTMQCNECVRIPDLSVKSLHV